MGGNAGPKSSLAMACKNHATVGAQRGVQLFISRGPGLGDDFSHITSKAQWVQQYPKLQQTFSNCYLNGEKVGSNVDKAKCYGTFEMPSDLKDGIYTFMWWWEFNAGEFYNSCADGLHSYVYILIEEILSSGFARAKTAACSS